MEPQPPSERSLATEALLAPVTSQRKLNIHLQEQMPKPYLARALAAVDPKNINGSVDHQDNNMSVLQQHVAFFDKNKDGIIYIPDTYKGLRIIGFNIFLSFLSAIGFHIAFSFATQPGWIKSLLLPIYISHIHKGKHGSDTETYDTEGRFDPAKFDAIFSKFALKHPDKISFCELQNMLKVNRNLNDIFGWLAAEIEWVLIYILINRKGLIEKEELRAMFDGSLFEILEKKNTEPKRY